MTKTIYLDYAATTPVDPRVAETLTKYLTPDGILAIRHPAPTRWAGRPRQPLSRRAKQVAALISCDAREVVWTSGATESDNLAIKGAAQAASQRGRHIITSRVEHKAVLDCFEWLETQGFEVTWLDPDQTGRVDPDAVAGALREDTVLVSLMAVNNELGVCNDIERVGAMLREKGVIFHVDAAQAAGKMALDVSRMPVDLMALSAHKVYGPKGHWGALCAPFSGCGGVRPDAWWGHERGLRSGTLATHQIAAMGHAFALARMSRWRMKGQSWSGSGRGSSTGFPNCRASMFMAMTASVCQAS